MSKPTRGADAVLKMRDEFVLLVAAYNAVSEYKAAQDAQVLAIVLNDFEDNHDITDMEWPARVIKGEYGPDIAAIEERAKQAPPAVAPLIAEATDTQAIIDVLTERRAQVDKGYTAEHDDEHSDGELAAAAGIYALHSGGGLGLNDYDANEVPKGWPFDRESWKPKTERENLVRAAAMILAEIERIDRSAGA